MYELNLSENINLKIDRHVLTKMLSHRQIKQTALEAGGILLGKCTTDGITYVITDLTEPSARDKRSRFSFIRNKDIAQRIINERWMESNGEVNYMGEWHTHPESRPTPSNIDRNLIRQIIEDKSNVFDIIILIIIGNDDLIYISATNTDNTNEKSFNLSIKDIITNGFIQSQ